MSEELVLATAAATAIGYVAQKVFGPTLDTMGKDLDKVWAIGRQRIIERAAAKTKNLEDGKTANLRVTRDVIWNGAVTDDEVCAEYFGGILAASRTEDGKDDSAIQFVDCIKAMSAKQLHLHYAIYHSLQAMMVQGGKRANVGLSSELDVTPIWLSSNELTKRLRLNPIIDLTVLHRQGLIVSYKFDAHYQGGQSLPYCQATPTTFGCLLYSVAMNRLEDWHEFSSVLFEGNPAIAVPEHFTSTLEKMIERASMPPDSPPASDVPAA